MSVPHSGTRTLVQHLGISAKEQGIHSATWLHFGHHDLHLKKYRPHMHIPIRHPLDVAKSWGQRRKTGGDPLRSLLDKYQSMFSWIADSENYTLYRMEDLPRLAGTGDHEGAPESSNKITRYQDAVRTHVIEPHLKFFARFYPDLKADAVVEKTEAEA